MPKISTYLTFTGDCDEAMTLYADIFGGTLTDRFTYGGSPMIEHMPQDFAEKVMHVELLLANGSLMGSDAATQGAHRPMTGASVAISVATPKAAHQAFARLAEGGTVKMPIQQTFWNPSFGMLTDRYGVNWLISSDTEA